MGSVGKSAEVTRVSSMASDLAREESFRTSLRNQKRRLSTPDRKPSVPDTGLSKAALAGVSKRDSLTPPGRSCLTPPRSTFTPPRRDLAAPDCLDDQASATSKQSTPDIHLEFYDVAELSPLSTPAGSRSPSPYELIPRSPTLSPSPSLTPSPIPLSSPLLSPHTESPALKRAKS